MARNLTVGGINRTKKSRTVRRESNEELFHRTKRKLGFVRVRIVPQIYDAQEGNFFGWEGESFTLELPNSAVAREMMTEIHAAIARVKKSVESKVKKARK